MRQTTADVVREIVRWSESKPDLSAPPFLLSRDAYGALRQLRDDSDGSFETVSMRHRLALRIHLAPILSELAEGRPATAPQLRMLEDIDDPIQSVFAPEGVLARIQAMRSAWRPFTHWWSDYFPGDGSPGYPVVDLWQLYIPMAQWIVRDKRKRRPHELFMVGFNGSPGAGKTVLTNALTVVLNQILDSDGEGRAIARSGDDWYLSKKDREPLRQLGYDPGVPGLSNRALPGTHDLAWLERNIRELEVSTPHAVTEMGNFDKKLDDQPDGPNRYCEVRGKVGVFLFDLWYAGANTDVDPMRIPDGLKRRVAENLRKWKTVFDRMDALWVFD